MDILFDKPRIFIGSATENIIIANAVRNNLSKNKDMSPEVWTNAIPLSTDSVLSGIIKSLLVHDFGLFIITPVDTTCIREKTAPTVRNNVILELGVYLGALGPERTYCIGPRGVDLDIVSDLKGVLYASYDPDDTRDISRVIEPACDQIREAIKKIGISSSHYFRNKDPKLMKSTIIGSEMNGSPLTADDLISMAEDEIFFAAQNHYHILVREPDNFKKKLFSFLTSKSKNLPERRVRFLICDPNSIEGVKAWKSIFAPMPEDTGLYHLHLKSAYRELQEWVGDAAKAGLLLEAASVPLVPTSVNFIDPKGNGEGLAVIVPNMFEGRSKARKPVLISKLEHRDIFTDYWSSCETAFECGTKLT